MPNERYHYHESCSYYERYANTPSETAQSLFFYPQWTGHFICKKDFYIERTGYESLLLIFTRKGKGTLFFREEEYHLCENSLALINCREPHRYFPVSEEPWDFRFIHFYKKDAELFYERIYAANGGCLLPSNDTVQALMEQALRIHREEGASAEVESAKTLSNLMYELLRPSGNGEKSLSVRVCDYIAKHYRSELTTEMIAKSFHFSRSYLSTVFKRQTGKAIHDYLLCYRLNQAKGLLVEGELSISDIAEKSGFGDTGTFIRAFRKKEGVTPLHYRKSFRG